MATVDLNVFGLTLSGGLTLTEANSILNTNSLDVVIAGDFMSSGVYNAGTNTTTFNGSNAQLATFNTLTSFNNFNVDKSSGVLTLNGTNDPTITNDLTILNGILEDGGRTLNVMRCCRHHKASALETPLEKQLGCLLNLNSHY